MHLASSTSIATGFALLGAMVLVWALARRRRIQPPPSLMVMPRLGGAPQPHARFAKGSVEFASVDASVADVVERPRSLRPSHARRTV